MTLALASGDDEALARVLTILAWLDLRAGRLVEAVARGERARSAALRADNAHAQSKALAVTACAFAEQGDVDRAAVLLEASLAVSVDTSPGDQIGVLGNLCDLHVLAGRPAEGYVHGQRALVLARRLGSVPLQITVLEAVGRAAVEVGALDEARDLFREALGLEQRSGTLRRDTLVGLALVASSQGEVERAVRLVAGAFDVPAAGSTLLARLEERLVAELRSQLPLQRYEELWAAGTGLEPDALSALCATS